MICLHGHDHPRLCKQCPKNTQETREAMVKLLTSTLPNSPKTTHALLEALDLHERAFQHAHSQEIERLQKYIHSLSALLDEAQHTNGKAIMAKLKEIEMKIDEGFGGG